MSQFGGSPRDADYGFFTTPKNPTVPTNQFGAGDRSHARGRPPTAAGVGPRLPDDDPLPPAFGLPAPPRRAHAQPARPRSRRLLLAVFGVLMLAVVAGGAASAGMIPGINRSPDSDAAAIANAPVAYTIETPRTLLGWKRSSGDQAKQIDLLFRATEAFPDDQVTTFLYVDAKKSPKLYGEVIAAPASKSQQKSFVTGIAISLRTGDKKVSVGPFKTFKPGELGGDFRCSTLGTPRPSTACTFSNSGASGLIVVVGQSGTSAVDKARKSRAAIVKTS